MQLQCVIMCLLAGSSGPGQGGRLVVVDVGYGLSVLVQDPSGTALLADGGYDEEAPVVREALRQAGVDSLALMVASHGHGDHLEGLTRLLREGFPVGLVIGNVPFGHQSFDSLFWRGLGGVPYRQVDAGDSMTVGGMTLHILHPDTLTGDLNESSMVLRLTMGSHRVLLPGDIGVHTQELLAHTRSDALRADILVAPHHGDLIAADFWECVDPAWVLVPVGPNPWELPDTTSLRVAAGRRLIDTRCDGTVVLSLGEEGIAVACRTPHSFTERRETEMAARIRRWRRAQ